MMHYSMSRRKEVLASGIYEALLMSPVYGAVYYLPIYFQAVNNVTAMLSGVYLLPMILAQLFTAGAAGGVGKLDAQVSPVLTVSGRADVLVSVTKIGYVIPAAVFSTVFLSVGSGLYSSLQPGSSTGEWVGFQIIHGIGSGAVLQLVYPL